MMPRSTSFVPPRIEKLGAISHDGSRGPPKGSPGRGPRPQEPRRPGRGLQRPELLVAALVVADRGPHGLEQWPQAHEPFEAGPLVAELGGDLPPPVSLGGAQPG